MGTALGLIGVIVFVASVIVLAATVTWLVVKLSPIGADEKPSPRATPS
jgi:FlaG/FlaF family flagellin (archaellin)